MMEYENLKKANLPFLQELKEAAAAVLESGWYILGERARTFEGEFASYCGVAHCAGVASGLDALVLSLESFRFEAGSEVIVPSNTYIATILAVLRAGLRPVLVEPDLATYNIDPARVEERITDKTVALLPVHLYGKVCDMESLLSIAGRHRLRVIEDCAQAHGAALRGKRAGSFGDCAAFSFYPTKNLGGFGDGGCVVSGDGKRAEAVRVLRNYGSSRKYHNEVVGHNSRLDEVQAALLSVKLRHLEGINAHKRRLATLYLEGLKEDFVKPVTSEEFLDVYHIFPIRHPERERVREHLLRHGIATEVHYPVPPHRQDALQGLLRGESYPLSEEIHATVLSLPISFGHSEEEVCRVIETLNRF